MPHIIEPSQPKQRRKRQRASVNILSPQQMFAKPSLVMQIRQTLDNMNEQEIFQAIAPKLSTIKDWEKRLSNVIEGIKQREEKKRLKHERDTEENLKKINHPCYKLLDAYFRAIHFHEKDGLLPYSQMNAKEITALLTQLKTYECYRKDFNDIKPQALGWLRNLSIDKQTANTPEKPTEKRSLTDKILRR